MALSIKTEEADRLARELARRTGETLTEAVTAALRQRLDHLGPEQKPAVARDLLRLGAEIRRLLDDASPATKAEFDELTEGGDPGADRAA